jgi:hypothetical protein
LVLLFRGKQLLERYGGSSSRAIVIVRPFCAYLARCFARMFSSKKRAVSPVRKRQFARDRVFVSVASLRPKDSTNARLLQDEST